MLKVRVRYDLNEPFYIECDENTAPREVLKAYDIDRSGPLDDEIGWWIVYLDGILIRGYDERGHGFDDTDKSFAALGVHSEVCYLGVSKWHGPGN